MPVKIKHKHDGEIKTVAYVNWISHYNHTLWEVMQMWDVGKIYNVQGEKPIYQSTVDKKDFLDAIQHPTNKNALDFEPLPNIDNEKPHIITGDQFMELLVKEISENKTPEAKEYNKPYKRFRRFLNKKSVLYAIKNGIKYGERAFIGIWKFIVLISATFLGGWLAIDHNYEKVWNWIKAFF